jgi:hypothetical protein
LGKLRQETTIKRFTKFRDDRIEECESNVNFRIINQETHPIRTTNFHSILHNSLRILHTTLLDTKKSNT